MGVTVTTKDGGDTFYTASDFDVDSYGRLVVGDDEAIYNADYWLRARVGASAADPVVVPPRVYTSLTEVPVDFLVYDGDGDSWLGEGPNGETDYDKYGPFRDTPPRVWQALQEVPDGVTVVDIDGDSWIGDSAVPRDVIDGSDDYAPFHEILGGL